VTIYRSLSVPGVGNDPDYDRPYGGPRGDPNPLRGPRGHPNQLAAPGRKGASEDGSKSRGTRSPDADLPGTLIEWYGK
jgi:hypothetical protein